MCIFFTHIKLLLLLMGCVMWKITLFSLFFCGFSILSVDVHRGCSARFEGITKAYKDQILPENEFYLAALYGRDLSRPDHRAFEQAVLAVLAEAVYADMGSFVQALNQRFDPQDYSNNPA